MLALLPRRSAIAAGALLGLLVAAGCGGNEMGADGADQRPTALAPDGLVAATLAPVCDILALTRDTARFVIDDAPGLLAAGADESDSLVALPGRRGLFTLEWFDSDRDGVLSSGDGLRLDAAPADAPGATAPARDGVPFAGLHMPGLTIGGGSFAAPALYADLTPAPGDSTNVTLSGTLAVSYVHGAIGERLTIGCGAAGFRRTASDNDAVLDSLALTLELQPYTRSWTMTVRAALATASLGALTLDTTTPLRGVLGSDGALGPAEAGRFVVRRADGGVTTVQLTGLDAARIWSDADGNGIVDDSSTATWTSLINAAR